MERAMLLHIKATAIASLCIDDETRMTESDIMKACADQMIHMLQEDPRSVIDRIKPIGVDAL